MAKITNVRDRVHSVWKTSRLFTFHGYSVAIDVRHLSSLKDCKRTLCRYAADEIWWIVGRIYGAMHDGTLPDSGSQEFFDRKMPDGEEVDRKVRC